MLLVIGWLRVRNRLRGLAWDVFCSRFHSWNLIFDDRLGWVLCNNCRRLHLTACCALGGFLRRPSRLEMGKQVLEISGLFRNRGAEC